MTKSHTSGPGCGIKAKHRGKRRSWRPQGGEETWVSPELPIWKAEPHDERSCSCGHRLAPGSWLGATAAGSRGITVEGSGASVGQGPIGLWLPALL